MTNEEFIEIKEEAERLRELLKYRETLKGILSEEKEVSYELIKIADELEYVERELLKINVDNENDIYAALSGEFKDINSGTERTFSR